MIIVALRVGLLWITALGASAAPALDGEISWQPEEQGVLVDRGLPLEGGNNFRDLGGYQTAQGRQVVWGTLFRSGSMSGLTDADYALLGTLGIRVISDLRSTNERQREPTRWRGSAGKDRTGIAAALLLTALGVPRSDVVDDYLLSNRYYRRQPVDPEQLDPSTRFLASLSPAVVNILTSVQREFIDASFEAIEARHGSVEHYLEVELGVDESARVRLVELYTRPL